MRDLCSIVTIKKLTPIEGKDRIVLASFVSVDYKVIVDTTFKVGDKVIYVMYDAILPVREEFEFLRKRCYKDKYQGFRISAMKMGGIVSEGLALPISVLPEAIEYKDDTDVTEKLGVVKYDPENLLEAMPQKKKGPIMTFLLRYKFIRDYLYSKEIKGGFPTWASKSDETRCESLPYVFDSMKGKRVYVSEKMDGTSFTCGYYKHKFYICSRNNLYKKKVDNYYWRIFQLLHLEKAMKKMRKMIGADFYIQGEICGPGIQKNIYGFTNLKLFVYNIKNILTDKYLGLEQMVDYCHAVGIEIVPILEIKNFNWNSIEEIQEYSKGKSEFNKYKNREGIVVRPVVPELPLNKMSNMMSFKVINPDFLVEKEAKE